MRYSKTSPPSRIVVRAPNFIGDAVMAIPFFRALRAAFPEANITLVATPGPAGFLSLPIYSELFSEVWTLHKRTLVDQWQMAARIRRESFDVAISLPASTSSALLFCLSRVAYRIGWAESTASYFYHCSLLWRGRDSGRHKSELYLELLSLLSVDASGCALQIPLVEKSTNPAVFVIAPGASIALRQWPRLIEFLPQLRAAFPTTRMILVGGPGEKNWSEAVSVLGDPLIEDRIGQTSLAELVSVCAGAKVVVAMDSGIAHLAASVAAVPTVVVFGPGDPAYVLPRGKKVRAVRRTDLPCSPCESAACAAPYGYQACLKDLAPRQVLDAVRGIVES